MSDCSWPRMAVAVWFLLVVSCATSPEVPPPEGRSAARPTVVRTRPLPGGALQLAFEPVAPDLGLERVRVEEAREVLAAFRASFPREEGRRFRLVSTSTESGLEEWEQRMREDFVSRFGPPEVALPWGLETSRLLMALKLSPRYMGEGVREAARELFSSRVFLSSVALSVLVYFSAWLVPEPLFTKAWVATWTLRLTLLVGAVELSRFAHACVRLYQEAQAARTVEELEAVAERFGKAMGGTGLRVLMVVASLGVAKGLPEVPSGGLGALLRAPRFALPEGMSMGSASTVQMVADGTVVVTGMAAGTAAASAVGSACTDGSKSQEGYHWHHLATNKNDISERFGGPWTPRFEQLFESVGMSLDAAENLVYLKGHKGPHPEAYHREVYSKLRAAVRDCEDVPQCRSKLARALKELADEICTPGSRLHRLATRSLD
ncbi:MAG TPA: AHH domain-containing protein [Archangium sp.]|uniref:AHH domain-containing protein n=1 Tax=Archangium sp. TaxID=1872627 RepID=UPI002E356944|nr:AHH domain-containing protein [Archangium sp.]HEX5752684.1 AHH domain-containing protein [Archangium sp.]